ncbi:MAG: tetratricopeptide repeat protein [Myxococcales bacterium]|nr:tetratricopeptide repeat protein [Myxococcales bacterium]
MLNVECPSCNAPYSISPKRVPADGMTMRCPKCSSSFVVSHDGGVRADAGAPRAIGAPQPPPMKPPLFAIAGADEALSVGEHLLAETPSLGEFGADIVAKTSQSGMIDAGFSAPAFGDLDATAIHRGVPMTEPSFVSPGIGGIFDGLPAPDDFDDLPAPVEFDDLPAPIDTDDLPATAGLDDLPDTVHFDNLPSAAGTGGFGSLGNLPTAQRGSGAGLPATLGGQRGVNPPFGGQAGLPAIIGGQQGGQAGLPANIGGVAHKAPSPQAGLPAVAGAQRGARVGEEFSVEEADHAGQDAGFVGEDGAAPQVKIRRKRGLRLALAIVPALAIAGGALSLTPAGPYGFYALSDAISRSDNEAALTALTESQTNAAELDLAGSVGRANAQCLATQKERSRYAPIAAYCAHRIFVSSLRFGRDAPMEAEARELIKNLNPSEPVSYQQLATAGKHAIEGQLDEAQAMAEPHAGEFEGAVLVGEIALAARKFERALSDFESAAKLTNSARTAFGILRAQHELGRLDVTMATARAVLKLSPNHAGARTLLAATLSTKVSTEAQATALLDEVVKDGPVRAEASPLEIVSAYTALGLVHLLHSRMSAAETAFHAALALAPQAEDALVGTGELFYESGRYADALGSFEAARRKDHNHVQASVGVAKVKLAQELPKDALAELTALAAVSKDPTIGYWLGRVHLDSGEKVLAEKEYRGAIAGGGSNPGVVRAFVALAELLESQGKRDDAAKVLATAAERLPNSFELHMAQGDVALNAGRLEEAALRFGKALAIDEQNLAATFRLAVTHRRDRQFDKAKQLYEKVAKTDPNYPGLALEWGLLFEETNEGERALKMYEAALKKAPNDIDLMLRVGSTQVIGGRGKAAIPLLQKVYNSRRNSAEVNHFLGRAHLLEGDAAKALTYLRAATRTDASRPEYHLYLGWAANDAAQPAEATEAIERALELDKNLADAYWQRGVLLQRKGKLDEAMDDLRTAIEKRPTRYEAYAALAVCHQERTEYTEALAAWRKAVAGNDGVPEWQYRLAKILWDREGRDEATRYLSAAVDAVAKRLDDKQLATTPRWVLQANFLLGEALRTKDKARALVAYRAYLKMSAQDDAYRKEAEAAVRQLGGRI